VADIPYLISIFEMDVLNSWKLKAQSKKAMLCAFHAVMVITQQGSKMALKHQLLVMSFLLSRSFRSIFFFSCLHNYYSVDTAVGITLYHVARFRHLVSRIASFSFGNVFFMSLSFAASHLSGKFVNFDVSQGLIVHWENALFLPHAVSNWKPTKWDS